MWRVLLYLVLLGIASYAAVWLSDRPETVAVTWNGREYSTSIAVGAVGLVVLAMLLAALWAAIRALMNLPGTIGHGSRRRRQERGHKALSRGIVAVGAGDVSAARRFASEAERLLGHQPLTLLLKAQAAQASGNREGAEAAFREMTEMGETRVLGLRGLFLEARRNGDHEAARGFAEEAARAAPAIGWANDAVLEGHSADGNWVEAVRTVERRTSLGLVDRATSRRQRAVLYTADALTKDRTEPDAALRLTQEALKLAPNLVPAAALAGQLLSRRGDLRRAAGIIEAAWRAEPHPDLADAYLNLRPGDSAIDRLRRAETLARLSSWAPESRLAIARAAIEARQPQRAREVIRPLLDEGRPTLRVCLMMADIEEADGAPGRVREWLSRATRASRDRAWVADGIVSERWAPVSPVTGRLDAFVWETPPELLGGPELAESDVLTGPGRDGQALLPPIAAPSGSASADETTASVADHREIVPASIVESATGPAQPAPGATTEIQIASENHDASGRENQTPPRPELAGERQPGPVAFPVGHAPDDPGTPPQPERSRFRLIG